MLNPQSVSGWPDSSLRVAQLPDAGSEVCFCDPDAAGRDELEAFITAAFQRQHGAVVRSFMPMLIGLRQPEGTLVGGAGYRQGDSGHLYLEQYLPQPVETVIARQAGAGPVARASIAEIGNFACRDCPSAVAMVGVLAEFLLGKNHDWVVFTATRTVRRIMRHMGLRLAELGQADRSRLAASDDWGSYYECDPRIMLGYLPSWHIRVPRPLKIRQN